MRKYIDKIKWHRETFKRYGYWIIFCFLIIIFAYYPISFSFHRDWYNHSNNLQDLCKRVWFWIGIYIITKISFDDVEKKRKEAEEKKEKEKIEQQKTNIYNAYKSSFQSLSKDIKITEKSIVEWLSNFLWKEESNLKEAISKTDRLSKTSDENTIYTVINQKINEFIVISEKYEKTQKISEYNQEILEKFYSLDWYNFLSLIFSLNSIVWYFLEMYRKIILIDSTLAVKIYWDNIEIWDIISQLEKHQRRFDHLKFHISQYNTSDLFYISKISKIEGDANNKNLSEKNEKTLKKQKYMILLNWVLWQMLSDSIQFSKSLSIYVLFVNKFNTLEDKIFE